MNTRERLIDLIIAAKQADPETGSFTECLADHLIEHGVIVPPCKKGDKVYVISESRIEEAIVNDLSVFYDIFISLEITCDYNCDGCPFSNWSQNYGGDSSCSGKYGSTTVRATDFGKTVFLSCEDAERALEEQK